VGSVMHGMVTRLSFDSEGAADEELAELERQSDAIAGVPGFRALFGIKTDSTEVVVIRVFETAQGLGQSLGTRLRPDLAEHFSAVPLRLSGIVMVSRTA
jgi:hypothetical protein